MSLLRMTTTWFRLLFLLHTHKCQTLNQWTLETSAQLDTWRSNSNSLFIPQQSNSSGTIRLGQEMSADFDFIWGGRSNDPRPGYFENFFRVGRSAKSGQSCGGEGSRLPSFWLTNSRDTMHVSVSTATNCQAKQSLTDYGDITVGVSYHVRIAFNNSLITVDVTNNDSPVNGGWPSPDWSRTWPRTVSNSITQYLGQSVPIWWMSDVYSGSYYNRGNGSFSNVIIKSAIFPTASPTYNPTQSPTAATIPPTNMPSVTPTNNPSIPPTQTPTNNPSIPPTQIPTNNPSITPTNNPSVTPTNNPSVSPTINPSITPTFGPTNNPSVSPTNNPSITPTFGPTNNPSITPTFGPTNNPITSDPSVTPTNNPTIAPITNTVNPSVTPTKMPSNNPSITPTQTPTTNPSHTPTTNPSITPTNNPSITPTNNPSNNPSITPTNNPSNNPSITPTKSPTEIGQTETPSVIPTIHPSQSPSIPPTTDQPTTTQPSVNPSTTPSLYPTTTPSENPSNSPSRQPSAQPSFNPSITPSLYPTITPSQNPSNSPSTQPSTYPTRSPTTSNPSGYPTTSPTSPTSNPSMTPTNKPSITPTQTPSKNPSITPTNNPSETPTANPSETPTNNPTKNPTTSPTDNTYSPSNNPSITPTNIPSELPSISPTKHPTENPTIFVTDDDGQDGEGVKKENAKNEIWDIDPYTYIFYGAIVFVALLLIAMAVCCYCKFKPPSDDDEDGIEYHFDITGQSSGKKRTMTVPIDSKHDGYNGHSSKRYNGKTHEMTHVHTESHHTLNNSHTIPSEEHGMIGGRNSNNKPKWNPKGVSGDSQMTTGTGSATSDEDVLKGAYGGHIIANGDIIEDEDNVFPRDKLRTINDNDEISPNNKSNNNVIPPIDMNSNESERHLDLTDDEYNNNINEEDDDEYYDEEDEYEDYEYDDDDNEYNGDGYDDDTDDDADGDGGGYDDDDDDDEYDGYNNGQHMTVGAPPDYPYNRHHVDGDEQYIVEMITKDELRRKVETSLKESEINAISNKDDEYAQNIYDGQQQNDAIMNNVINEMGDDHYENDYHYE